ncbi:MAG TPA: hypothetical protein DCP92_07590 [Nitrospiraceae bacterium]|jgi:DNA-binding NtrC family response regulator|nr:hypothetical protein [Nitrospiraceae bacterium]
MNGVSQKGPERLPQQGMAPEGNGKTILLADDDASVREFTKAVLETFGYRVIEALDGEDAIEKFKENRNSIRLLIFDVVMPKKNGREAYKEILKIQPGAKALFISGYTQESFRGDEAHEEGIPFISKPFLAKVLIGYVNTVLN